MLGATTSSPWRLSRQSFSIAGCQDVRTYIQSGNVLFRSPANLAARIPAIVAQQLTSAFGFQVPVIIRSFDEWLTLYESNPFLVSGQDLAKLHVVFLADKPPTAQVEALESNRSPPDEFAALGREIFLLCPNGLARTRFTNAYWDSSLKTTSTIRNWKTTDRLAQMAMELQDERE